MTSAAVTVSRAANINEAVREVLAPVAASAPLVACIAYAGISHDHQALLDELRAACGDVPVLGVSSQGATAIGLTIESSRFLAVLRIYSTTVRARVASVAELAVDTRGKGRSLAATLGPVPQGPHAVLAFYDPLGGANVLELLAGLADGGYPEVYGGGAGQPFGEFVATYQFGGSSTVMTDGAVVLLLDGVTGVADLTHGATPIGLTMEVTKASGNTVLELDGRPALDVWCERLGVQAVRDSENTIAWALGVVPDHDQPSEGMITRAPFGFDEGARGLVLHAPIPTGATVQVCVRDASAVLDGATAMAQRLAVALDGRRPIVALSFECGGRAAPLLGHDLAMQELCVVQRLLPTGLPWFGLYAWGELAPVGGRPEFHNYTFPLCVLCEGA